uniref:Uncharacterized protein n=1 Tax=Heterorhabditis bacteriophora TaxID=37862 RepID=A0A1I7WNH4_HETBA
MPHVLHEIFYNEAVEGEEGKLSQEKSRIPTESAINEEYTSIEQSNKEEMKNEGYISDEKCNCQDCQIEDFLAQLYNIKNVCADLYIDEVRSLKSMTVEFIGQMWSEYTITWYAHNHCGVHHPLVSKKTLHVWADAILIGFGCMEQVDWNYERLEELHEDLVIHLKRAIYLFL